MQASFQQTGDAQSSVWSAGMVMGLIDDVPSCKELVEGMVAEAEGIIRGRLSTMVSDAQGGVREDIRSFAG